MKGVKEALFARLPRLYRLLQRAWHVFREFLERRVLGHRLQEWIWRTRHLYDRHSTGFSIESAEHPHRRQIVEAVGRFLPASSLLEVGCGYGANLVRLRAAYPGMALQGVDINQHAIASAEGHFRSVPGGAVLLRVGSACDLSFAADKSVELVLTDAVLMFVAPDNIRRTLSDFGRVARRVLIMNEYHSSDAKEGLYAGGRWVHDLAGLCRELFPVAKVTMEKSAYTGSDWTRFGTLVIVRF